MFRAPPPHQTIYICINANKHLFWVQLVLNVTVFVIYMNSCTPIITRVFVL